MNQTCNLAIFASGAGSNALKIIEHFRNNPSVSIKLILCNKPEAGVLKIADENNIQKISIEKESFFRSDKYVELLKHEDINLIVLAGFLWKVPSNLIRAFPERIINIHPALLPKYGGKGMYGHFVHEAVIAAHEKKSGITIHLVDEQYDHGKHLFQAECDVKETDTPDALAQKIHQLEHQYFPQVVEDYINSSLN
ncbi:phosphoribosylglycinamide formyltransferase [Arachidicoccus ginsenosidimutans]|uniref:phosphoribosylglycinamide formyltransferase n=1 Tax=Arachidicoccus sp. BS20 TaxID=1850526 RepID=UPI0007F098B5|nr:phosphoribosylglycinamide formyltransferase [Arachidicoccus sp. BS20]ANI90216.1 phosphoribosylglycinamide formyltransferase [Arachidicoccus sp. BS20]